MRKIEAFKKRFSRDEKVLSLISQIEAAMAPLAAAVVNSVRLPQIQKFRMTETELVDFTEKLSHIEHEAHMSLLRPVRSLDEYLGFDYATGCVVDVDAGALKNNFREAVKNWALRLQGVDVGVLYA